MKLPLFFRIIFNRFFFEKLFAIALFFGILFFMQDFFLLFFMTFLFYYLFAALAEWIYHKGCSLIGLVRSKKVQKVLHSIFRFNLIVFIVYVFFILLLSLSVSSILPKLIQELGQLPKALPELGDRLAGVAKTLEELSNLQSDLRWTIAQLLTEQNIEIITKFMGNLQNIGAAVIQFVLAIVLSFICIIDREEIGNYFSSIKKGNFAFLYREFEIIFEKINLGFWIIFKAQAVIAVINTALTTLGMFFIGYVYKETSFPYVSTLAVIVFVCGFIPIIGAFLSAFPILVIGSMFGGLPVVFAVIVMMILVHLIESYYLNPKIVSSYMHLPITFTFFILILSEHLLGFVGLLIGTPLFYITMDILKDFDRYVDKIKTTYGEIGTLKTETKEMLSANIRLSRSGKRGPREG